MLDIPVRAVDREPLRGITPVLALVLRPYAKRSSSSSEDIRQMSEN